MSGVHPDIINHLRREQLRKNDDSGEISIPSQRLSVEDEISLAEPEQDGREPGRVKELLSRFALRATRPELSGD